ncbi:homeobox protein vent1-like [Gouania willdenowi]|uniref:homeobox protein vent1-like n=1 Tax=Gouania willdenowi TaxID=441366 RepID=UPI001055EF9E|nr:homeobox protein vent1-like [Gouania willdenowi]
MGRNFTVDWLAQSHYPTTSTEERGADSQAWTHRPHIPCMVQPRPPTLGNGHLQLKHVKKHREVKGEQRCASPGCASPDSQSSGYSSGEDSKTTRLIHTDDKDETQRRVRTKFTAEQISSLENIFDKHKYLDVVERVKMAEKLELSETQVRTWFQNRRMKLKRVMQDRIANTFPHGKFQRLLPVHYHGVNAPHIHHPYYQSVPVPQMALQPHITQHYVTHYPPQYYGCVL